MATLHKRKKLVKKLKLSKEENEKQNLSYKTSLDNLYAKKASSQISDFIADQAKEVKNSNVGSII